MTKKHAIRLLSNASGPSRQQIRYASDPVYRARKIARQKAWNTENRARKCANDKKWSAEHGAAAAKRYRKRKKAKK